MSPLCTKKGLLWATPSMEKIFFDRNNKSWSAFRNFLFYQNICFDWNMNLFLSWVMFSVKEVSFPAKTAVASCSKPLLFMSMEANVVAWRFWKSALAKNIWRGLNNAYFHRKSHNAPWKSKVGIKISKFW